jgi:hypothetical protein
VRGAFQPKAPLTRRFASTSPTKGEVKSDLCNNALWERARVRGVFQPKAPLTRRYATTSPTKGEVKSVLCNNALVEERGLQTSNLYFKF